MQPRRVTHSSQPLAVLFDLDGTLADTAQDLAYALNQTLQHYGEPILPFERIRPVVSQGGIALIRLGFGMAPEADGFEERRQYLLEVYEDNLCRETTLFPGMDRVLEHLESRRLPWGIVTNKPHPEPILHACALLATEPAQSWYVGDAGRDIQAGRAAGCVTVGALYGYLHPEDPPESWQADLTIDAPEQLLDLMNDDSNAS